MNPIKKIRSVVNNQLLYGKVLDIIMKQSLNKTKLYDQSNESKHKEGGKMLFLSEEEANTLNDKLKMSLVSKDCDDRFFSIYRDNRRLITVIYSSRRDCDVYYHLCSFLAKDLPDKDETKFKITMVESLNKNSDTDNMYFLVKRIYIHPVNYQGPLNSDYRIRNNYSNYEIEEWIKSSD